MYFTKIDWAPSETIFKIGTFGIHYYSLMFIIAFGLGYYIMKKIFISFLIISLFTASPASASVQSQKFKNCSALQKVYEGGIAKSKKVSNKNK